MRTKTSRTSQKNGLCIGFNDHRFMPLTFPLGKIPQTQSAVKMHTTSGCSWKHSIPYLDYQRKVSDVTILDPLVTKRVHLLLRSWVSRLCSIAHIHSSQAFFITRTKSNFQCRRLYSHTVKKALGVLSDQPSCLQGFYSAKKLSGKGATYSILHKETQKHLTFFNNNFTLQPQQSPVIQMQMKIELFFKWIKQHLHIKAFMELPKMPSKQQIWIAISTYVLVAIVQKTFKPGRKSLHYFTDIKHHAFRETTQFYRVLSDKPTILTKKQSCIQLNLFN